MPKTKLSTSRWLLLVVTGAVLCAAGMSGSAEAATARVTWLPRGTGTVTSYRVYVRNAGSTYGATPLWSGNPTPAADGSMAALVTYTPATSGTNYFAVVAVSSTSGETGLSGELPIGSPNPCRNDSCSTKTSCNFSNRADGTSCDDASYCNGPEVCLAGVCDTSAVRNCADTVQCTVDACDETADKCTHTGPAGCCLACDSLDPCLANACAQGDCAAESGSELKVNRLKLLSKKSGIKMAAKGSFTVDPSIDPSTTGAVLEMRTPDGMVVYSSSIAAQSIKVGAAGGRYRFAAARSESDFLGNGLTRLDFRIKGDTWLVTAKAETPELMDAFLEPTITWVIRLGTSCARRMDMPCNQTSILSVCR
jgi:hypothetical protein